MRNLTIKRNKRFVACLGKIRFYIEDPTSDEITINGISCRKLGELKNGEEKTFSIGDESARIFAIADKLSKEFCNESYTLPAGSEDIYLTGQNEYNPASGNAFRFDGNDDPEALANRKRGKKKGIIVLCCAALVGVLIGLFSNGIFNFTKTYTIEDELRIRLPWDFEKVYTDNGSLALESDDAAIFFVREEFVLLPGSENMSLSEYAELVIDSNELTSTVMRSGDLVFFKYKYFNEEVDESYTFSSFIYKSDDAFWMVQIAVESDDYAELSNDILTWAKSVSFR